MSACGENLGAEARPPEPGEFVPCEIRSVAMLEKEENRNFIVATSCYDLRAFGRWDRYRGRFVQLVCKRMWQKSCIEGEMDWAKLMNLSVTLGALLRAFPGKS